MALMMEMEKNKTLLPFNKKVRRSIKNVGYLNVWEGSVRSSKTIASLIAFGIYVLLSTENYFMMSGQTIESLVANCIDGDYGFLALFPMFEIQTIKLTRGITKILRYNNKVIYLSSYNNNQSFRRIRGRTLGGIYIDEVNLAPKSFIDETFMRTVASTDRKHFWTLNPSDPEHYIYVEYIDKYKEEGLLGYYLWHFTLDDNPAISEERKNELKNQYSGIFYDRMILGKRTRADGIIYTEFNDSMIIHELPDDVVIWEIGNDYYGGSPDSATVHTLVGYSELYGNCYILAEFYDNTTMDLNEIGNNFVSFVDRWQKHYPMIVNTYHDPANPFIYKIIKASGTTVNIKSAKKIQIITRISIVKTLMKQGRFFIMDTCVNTISALNNAIWDPKNPGTRLDNGTVKIDCLDAMEYSIERHIKEMLAWVK